LPTPSNGTSNEGNPPVTAGLDGNTPGSTPPASTPGTPPLPTTPGAAEPTDCVIPPVLSTPVGYGAATTGGGDSEPVLVATYDEAQTVLDDYRDAFEEGTQTSLVLRYTGSFDFSTITDVCAQHEKDAQILEVKEIENVTIEGAPGSSANFGIKVSRAKNVIIRNMTLGLLPGGGSSDAITLEGNDTNGDVENVWVDHNELFSSTKDDCDGAGDTEFDGLIDIKKGARRITVSYNYLHDHQKTGLLGSSDDDATERYVSFHHNRYENVVSRTPLHRFGFIHVFNNYFGTITSSGINVRMGGVALIESNFFENAKNPITSRYSPEPGLWDLRDNHVGPGVTWDIEEDTLANADTWESTTAFPENELGYAYTADRAACIKQIVVAQAGAKL
jgi:pectate lyase